jgi:hypothetical protein
MKALVSKTIKKEHKYDYFKSTINAEGRIYGLFWRQSSLFKTKDILLK